MENLILTSSLLWFETIIDVAAVTVEVIESGFLPPYSLGNLNCFSALALCDDVLTTTFLYPKYTFSLIKTDDDVVVARIVRD